MKKFIIYSDHFEFRFGKAPIPSMSAEEILDTHLSCDGRITSNSIDPTIEAVFYSLADAKEEFCRNYSEFGYTRKDSAYIGKLLTGRLAWIEEIETGEDGDIIQSYGTLDVSAEPYTAEED